MVTFGLTVLAWIFFRAKNLEHAANYITEIFSTSLFTIPKFAERELALTTAILIVFFVLIEWQGREGQYAISDLGSQWKRPLRHAFYYALIFAIFWFMWQEQQFIYFQF